MYTVHAELVTSVITPNPTVGSAIPNAAHEHDVLQQRGLRADQGRHDLGGTCGDAFGFAASLYSILESGLCCGQSGTVLSSCTEEYTEHLLVKLTVIGCCNLLLQERCRSRTCSPASHRALNGWGPGVRTVLNMQHAFAQLLWKVAWLPPAERGALGGHESLRQPAPKTPPIP